MSRLTAGEIVVWLLLATAVGVVLGATVTTLWHRARSSVRVVTTELAQVPVERFIKGNATSKIFHVPGSSAYQRTQADVWFATEDEAVAAGYRKPKNA